MATKSSEVVTKAEEKIFFLDAYKFIVMAVLGGLLLFSVIGVIFFIMQNSSLEAKILKVNERLFAAVMLACKVDITETPKAISFVRDDDDILVLKCEPPKKKEK